MRFELLEKYRRWIWNCQQCSTCQKGPQNPFAPTGATPDRICPSYDKYRRLAYSAQGRIYAARAFLEKKLELTDDFATIQSTPFPHSGNELVPPKFVAVLTLIRELTFNNILGGDAGMIGPGHPEHVHSLHPFVSAENILKSVVESVPHV